MANTAATKKRRKVIVSPRRGSVRRIDSLLRYGPPPKTLASQVWHTYFRIPFAPSSRMRSQSGKILSRSLVAAALVSLRVGAQSTSDAAAIRSAAHTYSSAHEAGILREFTELLS